MQEAFERMAAWSTSRMPAIRSISRWRRISRSSLAFQARVRLVFEGREQPSGYTEPLLHKFRRAIKS